ncbi:MAG: hypothetical protein MH472_09870 [Bacteroidia bacterium]|nr:hypothetical protein [Bacteroidia bacterium]
MKQLPKPLSLSLSLSLSLILLHFSLQNFDFLTLENNEEGFYTLREDNFWGFWVNKGIRFVGLLWIIYIWIEPKEFNVILCILLPLLFIHFYLLLTNNILNHHLHLVLGTLLYSPLIGLLVLLRNYNL